MSRQLRRRRSAVAPSEGDDARGGEARPTGLRRVGRLLGLAGGGVAALGAVGIGLAALYSTAGQAILGML